MADIKKLESIASQVRRDIVRMTNQATCGHPGGSLGCADYIVALYFEFMSVNTDFSMDGKHEDLFFLSNGHISPVWYSVLARKGYFDIAELATFRKLNSRLQGHPTTHEGLPGIRMASGSLGQGLSNACGAAITKRMNGDDSIVYSLHGDGEIQEGQIWEAAMFAPHHKLDNLIICIDRNDAQIDGMCVDVMNVGDVGEKFRAFGWLTLEMDGNNMAEVVAGVEKAKSMLGNEKPVCIVMNTVMGAGVDYMEAAGNGWHGVAPNAEQTKDALAQLEETLGDY